MQMGLKRDRRSLRVGISHCWSDASRSSVVFSALVSRPHFRSNERVYPSYGSVAGRSGRISRPVVRFSLSNLYADSKELDTLTDAKQDERAKAVEGCFERSAAVLKQHG